MLFFLKKMVTPFILPPGFLVVILGLIGGWTILKKDRVCGLLTASAGALLWLLSIGPTADLLKSGLERPYRPAPHIEADVILMLGGDLYDRSADFSGIGAPGPGTMERLVTAARLHRRFHIPVVLSGGRVNPSASQSVAAVAKRFLVDLGIPPSALIVEENSRDTYENAVNCRNICQARGYSRPLLLTSGYHLKRALLSFRAVGLAVTPYPCALSTWQGKSYTLYSFLPSAAALKGTAQALHEWIGLLAYRLNY
jgi:uncharacterized SAM-binding protein YcdF (DUF218 family)